MIVRCEKCATRFRLDEAAVPASGVRVRCSRCRHAFRVHRSDDAVHAVAAQAAQREAGAEAADDADIGPVEPSPDQWVFEDDALSFHEAAEPVPDEDDALAGEEPAGGSGDLAGAPDPADPEALAGSETVASSGELSAAEDLFAAPGEFAADAAPMEPDSAPEAAPAGTSPEVETPDASDAGSAEALAAPREGFEPVLPAPESDDAAEDLGHPDTWDFVSQSAAMDPDGSHGAQSAEGTAGDLATGDAEALAGSAPRFEDDDLEESSVPVTGSPSRDVRSLAGRLAHVATAALVAWLVFVSLRPPAELRPAPVPLGPLVAEDVRAQRVENAAGETLLVVSGRLHNPGAGSARLEDALRVRVSGPLASEAQAFAGPAHDVRTLREAQPAELEQGAPLRARVLATLPLAAGDDVAFQAVFRNVSGATRVELDRVPRDRVDTTPSPSS